MENTSNLLEKIDKSNIPNHVAIIMDGNGRWAKQRKQLRSFGHLEGSNRVVDIVRISSNLGIKVLTLFAFSSENWKRPLTEIDKIMFLVVKFIDNYIDELAENNVKLNVLGVQEELPKRVIEKLNFAVEKTSNNTGMILNICLNYGSQQEILMASKNLIKKYKNSSDEDIDNISIEEFKSFLYTKENSDVDLLIRPSGELRISNFLLFQIAYAELYFSNILWPDFDENELHKAIISYQNRDRRYGGIK